MLFYRLFCKYGRKLVCKVGFKIFIKITVACEFDRKLVYCTRLVSIFSSRLVQYLSLIDSLSASLVAQFSVYYVVL